MFKNEYVIVGCISRAKGRSTKIFSILKFKDLFYQFCKRSLRDGHNASFWEDWWVDDEPLKIAYPRLYLLSFGHNINVVEAL